MSQETKSLKEALHNTIHRHSTLSVAAIAEEIGMAESYLYRAALPDQDTDGVDASGVRFPIKKLVPLVRATSDFQVLDHIERSLGRVAFYVPDPSRCSSLLHSHLTKTVGEFSDVLKAFELMMEDGKVTQAELASMEKEVYELNQALMSWVASTRQTVVRENE